jgi:type I restriction enzyme S subunit
MSKLDELIVKLCPDGVEYKTIGSICSLSAGGDVPKDRLSDKKTEDYPIPIYSNGIGENALYGWTDTAKIDTPCVTVAARGTIGYCALRDKPFFPVVRLICVVPYNSLNVRFLKYVMEIIQFQVPASGIPQLTVPMLEKYKIPIPPLPIQLEIIRILDKFISLGTELETELEARKKQYEYYSNSLLTVGGDVERVTIGEVLDMKAGKSIQASEISNIECDEFAFPCFGGNGLRGYVKQPSHDGKFVIIGRQGALCGNVKRIAGEFYATEHAVVVNAKPSINIDWAFHMLNAMNLNQYATKSAQPGLSVGKLETLTIPVPPLLEQERIAVILERFDVLVNDITQGLPAEISARRKQYEYYRDKLLTFKEKVS